MLARAGSDASTHLRRTKSATSVKQRRHEHLIQEPLNPETARIHALTAAHIAMGLASERASIEMRRSADPARFDSNAGRSGHCAAARSQPIRSSPASELRRQRSILQSKGSSIVLSSHNPTENPYPDLSYYTAHPPSELGATGYGSEPSSYRRLRKVKSVVTPRKPAMGLHNRSSCSPSSGRTLQNAKSSVGDAEKGLKLGLKRSMSFLRGSSGNLSKPFKRAESQTKQHDEAIRLAQEQFLNDLEQQKLRKKKSFFTTKIRPPQKPFRKTVRSSRTTEFGDGVKSENRVVYSFKPESKSRSISASFRDKMKHIFGRSVSNKDKFPTQQLDARRPYFHDYVDGSGTESALDQYFVDDNDATARGSLYIPSNHEHDSFEDLDQLSATLRSAQSMDSLHSDSRSRVTSWTTSTMTNSVEARGTPLERKRLSIIKEDGGSHQPSPSIGRHVGGIEVFPKPLPSQSAHGQPALPVDSHTIYSALMKRIDQEEADAESSQGPGNPVDEESNTLPSSAQSHQTALAIHAVPSEPSPCTIAPDKEHRQFSIVSQPWHEGSGMTQQELAQDNENVERRRVRLAEQEHQPSFFPFSDHSKPRTPSPFKLALKARKENSGISQSEPDSVVVGQSADSDAQVQDQLSTSSDSIYSRTTGGHANLHMLSGHTSPEDTDNSPPMGGMVTIIPTREARYPRLTPSQVQLHRARSSERGEWKGWMGNQMTGLNRHNSRASTSHHPAHAQMDGDDTAIGGGGVRPKTSTGFGPELCRHGSQRTVKNVKDDATMHVPLQRNSSFMNERFPLLDLKGPRNSTPKPTASELKRASLVGMNDENKKLGGTDMQRRASGPLRGKTSQVSLKYKVKDENSPPVSTPGRLHMSGHETRKAGSFTSLKELTPTPQQRPKSRMILADWGQFGRNVINDSEHKLSSLSRPFEMDTPDGNRPFDSEYLGTKQSYSIGGKAGRLGVAPTTGAATPEYFGDDEDGDTVLPKIQERGANNENKKMTNSKRMVSNFLRSRRKNTPTQDQAAGTTTGSSPAFV